ncbi:MAG: dihydrolipoyl dehydrogenase [Fretibacterium sp.]|nr:dihydrolipoyl dehydrogenase [Fretibacterium sp.]
MKKRIVIIGAGPGGYVAAVHAAHLGAEVTLIEKKAIGGTCLNVGCIPTKVLLHTADLLNTLKSDAKRIGVLVDNVRLDWKALMRRKNLTVSRLGTGTLELVKSNGIEYVEGAARILSPQKVEASGHTFDADAIIIATGSVPDVPDLPGYDLDGVITSDEALSLDQPPASMVVSGGGIIGMEFAAAYAAFGTQVTVVVTSPEVLRNLDTDIALILRKALEKKGVAFQTSCSIPKVEKSNGALKLFLETPEGNQELVTEKLLVAKGRKPYTEGLGLEALGIQTKRGRIVTDKHMQTNVPNVYAIGDCVNDYMLAHVASREGEVAAENIMGNVVEIDYLTTPGAIYTSPEIATVGLMEKEAQERGIAFKVGRFPLASNGKSMITGDTSGVVKVIADEATQKIIGVQMVGGPATDMIAEGALALHFKATPEDLVHTIHAHPTVSESVMEAAANVFAQAIHTPKK